MTIKTFDGADLKKALHATAHLLAAKKEEIDALNVFPVPDGDTGSNMYTTFQSAVNEALKTDSISVGEVAEAAATGSLMGARGNSGVILSQLLRGLAKGLKGKEKAGARDLSNAFSKGVEVAYKAVMKPVEGTILTVAREAAKGAREASLRSDDLLKTMMVSCQKGNEALARTPEMLPVLKQAGVVDAGGKGLMVIMEGILLSLKKRFELEELYNKQISEITSQASPGKIQDRDYNFSYCTELIIKGLNPDVESIRGELSSLGDSLIVVGEGCLVKVHIHSNHPGQVLEACLKYGSLHDLKIENMEEQKENAAARNIENKTYGIITVSPGEGLSKIFKSLGAHYIVPGGQTMNPSTEEILKAIEQVPSKNIFLLPNNKNIILSMEQAKKISKKNVFIIPSKSIPQGIASLLVFNPEGDPETNFEKMKSALTSVKTGEITKAVRDSYFEGKDIKEGNIIGLIDGKLEVIGESLENVLLQSVRKMVNNEYHFVTLYQGQETDSSSAEKSLETLLKELPQCEFELQDGGQPLYHWIISVE